MKQLGLGFMQYIQDYDEVYPCGNSGWAGHTIYPYVKSKDAFTCPSDVLAGEAGKSTYCYGSGASCRTCVNNCVESSYGFNGLSIQVTVPIQMSQFTASSKTVLLFEVSGSYTDPSDPLEFGSIEDQNGGAGAIRGGNSNGTGNRINRVYMMGLDGQTPIPSVFYKGNDSTQELLKGRHNEGANYLACDGHVKWLLPTLTSTGKFPASPDCDQNGGSANGTAACGAPFTPLVNQWKAAGTNGRNGVQPITLTFSYI
jgi:prepilin-type processing-associated H-X9-DG protein